MKILTQQDDDDLDTLDTLSITALRNRLIDCTIALADELASEGDRDRLLALSHLYETTRDALAHRSDLRVVR